MPEDGLSAPPSKERRSLGIWYLPAWLEAPPKLPFSDSPTLSSEIESTQARERHFRNSSKRSCVSLISCCTPESPQDQDTF